jgi:hypothetical protein
LIAVLAGQAPEAPPQKQPTSVDIRREARDAVLKTVGEDSRKFLKAYGDLSIATLQAVPADVGKKIVGIYNSGELARIKNPRAVLDAIRQHGEPVGKWVCEHHQILEDGEALEIFCKYPLDVAFDLRDVESSAAELRASRKLAPSWLGSNMPAEWNGLHILIGVLVVALIVAVFWRKKKSP